MFLEFHKLREQPFNVTPDPRFLYLGPTHREALASLFYGVETGRGFLALVAEPGMGKTTLLLQLLERLQHSARTVLLSQTQCDSRELLRYLLGSLGLDSPSQDIVIMHEKLHEVMTHEISAGRRFVLVIDEAQNLDNSVLETVRLLSNFETPSAKMLQIILAGQQQLANKLASPALAQLRQRIAILGHLDRFPPAETARYIDHRLRAAGYDGGPLFTSGALEAIAAKSQGIPRNINNLCFSALSVGYALGRQRIDSAIVEEAVADLDVGALVRKPGATQRPVPLASARRSELSYPLNVKSGFRRRAVGTAALAAVLLLIVFSFSSMLRRGTTSPEGPTPEEVQVTVAPADLESPDVPSEPTTLGTSLPSPSATLEQAGAENGSGETFTVVVEPKQTLRQISLRYLGRFDSEVVEQILQLNPGITDPNQIAIGQRIQLPKGHHKLEAGSLAAEAGSESKSAPRKGP